MIKYLLLTYLGIYFYSFLPFSQHLFIVGFISTHGSHIYLLSLTGVDSWQLLGQLKAWFPSVVSLSQLTTAEEFLLKYIADHFLSFLKVPQLMNLNLTGSPNSKCVLSIASLYRYFTSIVKKFLEAWKYH